MIGIKNDVETNLNNSSSSRTKSKEYKIDNRNFYQEVT